MLNPESAIPLQVVQSALRTGLPFIGVASITLAAGIAAIALWRLRSRERLLLWLGIFALMYAVRLFAENDLFRTAIGMSKNMYGIAVLIVTYIIPIPLALFFCELLGRGWKNSIWIWLWVQVVFAPVAIAVGIVGAQISLIDLANNILIIGAILLILPQTILPGSARPAAAGLKWPLISFGVLALLNNLGFRPARINIEPLGVLILLCGLSYTASRRAVARERKLTEVEQELATARRIQASILPRSAPHFSRLRVATRYEPMTAVAGDFYDFLKTGEDSLAILVADVSGHGVPAALVASMLKVCFASQRHQANDPAKVLSAFNTMLSDVLAGQYVTAGCAVINLSRQAVTYAGAGHPPAFLVRKNGADVMELAENGLFIGPFPHATYTNVSAPFESGDRLLLYTDGIIEATVSDGQPFGREGLREFLLDAGHLEPADFIEQLFVKISSSTQEDDLTVVLAESG